jgi:molybdopterin converting factor small subunit
MNVRVKLFAAAKEVAGRDEITVELADGATLGDARHALAAAVPALGRILPHALWAVDAAYADDDAIVDERSDVALIPPVSGG